MLVDSHCHLDRVDLKPYQGDFAAMMTANLAEVEQMLCVSIDLQSYPVMRQLIDPYPQVYVSVGVHPNESQSVDPEALIELAQDERNLAIGETGLDYYRAQDDRLAQQEKFCAHIYAAKQCSKPLIVHTRAAKQDTLNLLKQEGAESGVLHCFTEDWEMAKQALDLGFYLSFSGIITFKNAAELREVVRKTPLERLLIETDSPYLAPVPYRGKPNEPRYVRQVAEQVAEIKGQAWQDIAAITQQNFQSLFQQ